VLFPTTLVGSYPQPEWLIDRKKLAGRFPPRVRAKELWRIPEPLLAEALQDATLLAMPRPGGSGTGHHHRRGDPARELLQPFRHRARRRGHRQPGNGTRPLGASQPGAAHRRKDPQEARRRGRGPEVSGAHTKKPVKMTVPGPFTMSQQAQERLLQIRGRSGDGLRGRRERGDSRSVRRRCDIVQIDEPYMQARPEKARQFGLKALKPRARWDRGDNGVHICFGYAAVIHVRPSGYSFLGELAGCSCRQVSIETAQSNLDCSVLKDPCPARRSSSA